jgi:hypothetical protein
MEFEIDLQTVVDVVIVMAFADVVIDDLMIKMVYHIKTIMLVGWLIMMKIVKH